MAIELLRIGLHPGEPVRFLRADRSRWQPGTAVGVERDGSLAVRDEAGAFRAVPLKHVEVKGRGPRGGARWEPLLDRASRTEQLRLL